MMTAIPTSAISRIGHMNGPPSSKSPIAPVSKKSATADVSGEVELGVSGEEFVPGLTFV